MGSGTSLPELDSQAATKVRNELEDFFFFPFSGAFSGRAAATEAARAGERDPANCCVPNRCAHT